MLVNFSFFLYLLSFCDLDVKFQEPEQLEAKSTKSLSRKSFILELIRSTHSIPVSWYEQHGSSLKFHFLLGRNLPR